MKLTKAARNELREVLRHAERAYAYLDRKDVSVALKNRPATTTLHFKRDYDDSTLYEVDKYIGSDLCGLQDAISKLGAFLATH